MAGARFGAPEPGFRHGFELAGSGLAIVGPDGLPVAANAAFCAFVGLGHDRVLGTHILALAGPALGPELAEPLARLLAGTLDEVPARERHLSRPDGSTAVALLRLSALPAVAGGEPRVLARLDDVTELRRQQRRADEAVARFDAAVASAPHGIALVDLDDRFVHVNAALGAILGQSPERLRGVPAGEVTHPDDRWQGPVIATEALRGAPPRRLERRLLRADGSDVWAQVTTTLVRGADGAPRHFVLHVEDISARRHARVALERTRLELDTVLAAAPLAVLVTDAEGVCVRVDGVEGGARLLGHGLLRLAGETSDAGAALRRALAGRPAEGVFRVGDRLFRTRIVPLRESSGRLAGAVAVGTDVTQETQTLARLQRRERYISSILDSMDSATVVVDGAGRVVEVNRLWREQARVEVAAGADYLTACARALCGDEATFARLGDGLRGVLTGREAEAALEFRAAVPEERWLCVRVTPIDGADGAVVSHTDVTARRRVEGEYSRLALHDALTGLPNKVLFADRLAVAVARARRTRGLAGLLFVDVDGLKIVNDSLGHRAGDLVLAEMATRLRQVAGSEGTVARFGGDEFTLLLEDLPDETAAETVALRIKAAVEEPITIGQRDVYCSASVGIAFSAAGGTGADALLRNADAARYRAKLRGRARHEVYEASMRLDAVERLEVVNGLRAALAADDLILQYQPLVDLGTGRVDGVEALVRWRRRDGSVAGPETFVPIAEESDLIVQLGAWVLPRACRQAQAWRQRSGARPFSLSVNVSARELMRPGFVELVAGTLAETGLPGAALAIEITESTLLEDIERASRVLTEVKSLGVSVVIDDFGTGYSSLTYLQRFPVDRVKVERSFIAGVESDPQAAALLGAIVHLCHALGLEVVAEGVETEAQAALLRGLGCDLAQGYLWAPPLDAALVVPLLDAEHEPVPRQSSA